MFKIYKKTNSETGYPEIVQHLPYLIISNSIYCFCINNHPILNNQIGNILINLFAFIEDGINCLLRMLDLLKPKFNTKRPLIGFLAKPMPQLVQNLHGATNNLKNQLLFFQLLIGVHSR